MMLECLLDSITESCFYKISNEDSAYTITDGEKSALLLFKLLMSKAQVDTVATNYQFKTRLANLENYMGNVNSDIERFNSHVKDAKEGLSVRGEEPSNLIMELFKGYKVAADHEFIKYIRTREDRYLEGDTGLTDGNLMMITLNKYTIMKENGDWGAPTEQEEQLTALSTEVSKKIDALNSLSDKIKKKGKNDRNSNNRSNNGNRSNQSANSSAKSRKAAKEARNKWKKVPPSHGDPPTKLFEDRTYLWCSNHQAWCMHDPKVCTYKPESTGTPRSGKTSRSRQDKYSAALSTVMTQIDEDEDENNDSE